MCGGVEFELLESVQYEGRVYKKYERCTLTHIPENPNFKILQVKSYINGLDAEEYINSQAKVFKPVVLLGDANSKFADMLQVKKFYTNYDIIAVNRSLNNVKLANPVIGTATLHANELGSDRVPVYPGAVNHVLAVNGVESVYADRIWDISPVCGTSALFGCIVACALGYQTIIPVGVHLGKPPYINRETHTAWQYIWYPILRDKIKAVSGLPSRIYTTLK